VKYAEYLPRWSPYIPWQPSPKQATFLGPVITERREAMYGGSAGGGKSVALLMGALQFVDVPGYSALLLRRTLPDLKQPRALMPLAEEWLGGTDVHWNAQGKQWVFPSGATISFGYLESERDKYRYQGAEYQYIGFDELTQFTLSQYTYLFSRLRKNPDMPVPIRMRAASNPGGVGHEWVRTRFINSNREDRIYLPALLSENPHLDQTGYLDSLAELDPLTRQQLINGDWTARQAGGWFDRTKTTLVEATPVHMRTVRFWDLAATKAARGKDPDWTVGLKLGRTPDNVYYVLDVRRLRDEPAVVERQLRNTAIMDGQDTPIFVEQEPGSSGVFVDQHLRRHVLQEYTYRPVKPVTKKSKRAQPVSARWDAGDIYVLRAPWTDDFLNELEAYSGDDGVGHDDQVDALSGAFSQLAIRRDAGGLGKVSDELVGRAVELPHVAQGGFR